MMAATKMPLVCSLQDLLDGIVVVTDVDERAVTGLSLDSRRTERGDLFFALSGSQAQGADFISDAIARGASAVLVEAGTGVPTGSQGDVPVLAVKALRTQVGIVADRFFARPSQDLNVMGITGTNGKTSVSHFIASAMNTIDAGRCAVIGTLGSGLPGQLDASVNTTPDAITLHRTLSALRAQRLRDVVVEASSHGLQQSRLAGVRFKQVLFTNLSRDHLDYHGDMQSYGNAKQRLFARKGLQQAIVNGDDPFAATLLSSLDSSVDVFVCSTRLEASAAESLWPAARRLLATQIRPTGDGMVIDIDADGLLLQIRSALLGRFNADNLLLALASLLANGIAPDIAIGGLESVRPVAGRMEGMGQTVAGARIIVDYAHTPDALQQALLSLRPHCQQRLWCVFGCGGDRDAGKRPLMGAIAEQYADCVIVTDDNPRGESSADIIADIVAGMRGAASARGGQGSQVQVQPDRRAAIAQALAGASAGDVVLIAGKGHEDMQIIGGRRLPFSDRAVVRELLAAGQ